MLHNYWNEKSDFERFFLKIFKSKWKIKSDQDKENFSYIFIEKNKRKKIWNENLMKMKWMSEEKCVYFQFDYKFFYSENI